MQQIASVFDKIFKRPGLKEYLIEGQIQAIWPQIVGRQIAQLSKPVHFKNGNLFVRVSSPAWRNELNMMRSQIAFKMNEKIGMDVVKSIILR